MPMTGLVRRLTLTSAPPSRRRRPLRGLVVCGVGSKRRQASEAKLRRREIQEDAAPSEAARGFCRRCGEVHRLERTPRAEFEARALMRRIRESGRLDFDSNQPPDPRFAIEHMYKPGGGKMLGVLLAVPPASIWAASASASASGAGAASGPSAGAGNADAEDVVVLKAFSGQMYGEWTVPGWSPPLCGLTHSHPHYVREHARIKALVDAAGAKATVVEELGAEVKREEDAWDGRIDTLVARLREERHARRARRKRAEEEAEGAAARSAVSPAGGGENEVDVVAVAGGDAGNAAHSTNPPPPPPSAASPSPAVLLEEQLARESREGKRKLARLREERASAVAEPSLALAAAREEMHRLRREHRAASHVLLGEIFESYRLPSFVNVGREVSDGDGDGASSSLTSEATLREAFVRGEEDADDEEQEEEKEEEKGEGATASSSSEFNLPCGCGDCCAPKLLAECARRGLAPVAIAEVWMGVPTRKEGDRQEGSFYGACRGRCRPILGHMLCGADELLSTERRKKLIQLPTT